MGMVAIECMLSGTLSTLGQKLAEILCVPYISLDRLFWGPGWVENGGGELRRRLNAAPDDAEQKASG
ncbi:hypothetical protein HYDPIDRAFT_110500 [Hydnomerulius pinastri MD-312]|nr:hypothetical protein HYDPIDRAFT_110500 [Hydnomerulius pinastri MD-312]